MFGPKNFITVRKKSLNKLMKTTIEDFHNVLNHDDDDDEESRHHHHIVDYEITTEFGWSDMTNMINSGNVRDVWEVETTNFIVSCCCNQKFLKNNNKLTLLNQLNVGDMITTENGLEPIESLTNTNVQEVMYELFVKTPRNVVYVGGVLST
jgi:hypothetical protein|tara:strand:- start:11800 stop:12252 length:453 start_codon:yes stop_codon:yes gene_type:complete